MSKNIHGKTRNVENPYYIIVKGDWEWRILKRYQSPEKEKQNQDAYWFCAVKSPHVTGWEYGDTYIKDIPGASPGMDF